MPRSLFAASMRLIAVLVVSVPTLSAPRTADARPAYKKVFEETYPAVKEANAISCTACHGKASKKERNDYGQAMTKVLEETNLRDPEKITEALKNIESAPSAIEGKTFGDLLKEGKLPAGE